MSEVGVRNRNDTDLCGLVGRMGTSIASTVGALVSKPIKVTTQGSIGRHDPAELGSKLGNGFARLTGDMSKDLDGKKVHLLIEASDAIALAGYLLMTPDDKIETLVSAGNLDDEHTDGLGEVGNVIYSGLDEVLREHDENSTRGIIVADHGRLSKGDLGDAPIEGYLLELQIGEGKASKAYLLFDGKAADRLNQEELVDTDNDEIPQAPICGHLDAFLTDADAYETVRNSCRRVGLDLHRFRRADVPNPAAHKGRIVLLEIPVADDRRFDWVRRLKDQQEDVAVMILLHGPSRNRVVQAFMTKADAILGWPCKEPHLSAKLAALLPTQDSLG